MVAYVIVQSTESPSRRHSCSYATSSSAVSRPAQLDEVLPGDRHLLLARLRRRLERRVVRQRRVAAHPVVVLDPPLGRQAVVVPPHRVEDLAAAHALVARDGVGVRVGEHVPDVQRAAHRGRRGVDRVDLATAPWCGRTGRCPPAPIRRPSGPRDRRRWACPGELGRSMVGDSTERARWSPPHIGATLDSADRDRPLARRRRGRARTALARVAAGPDPGPHPGPARPARLPADGVPGAAGRRHERQDLDGADGRRPAARARPAGRPLHQPAPGAGHRADQPGRHTAARRRLRAGVRGDRARTWSWSTPGTTTRCRTSRR